LVVGVVDPLGVEPLGDEPPPDEEDPPDEAPPEEEDPPDEEPPLGDEEPPLLPARPPLDFEVDPAPLPEPDADPPDPEPEPEPEPDPLGESARSFIGLKGFFSLALNASSFEPRSGPVSTLTTGSVATPLGLGAEVAGGAASDAGLNSTAGTATIAASRPTATGQRRFSRRSCQRSMKKEVIAMSPWRSE
jgi:hypothetical protein